MSPWTATAICSVREGSERVERDIIRILNAGERPERGIGGWGLGGGGGKVGVREIGKPRGAALSKIPAAGLVIGMIAELHSSYWQPLTLGRCRLQTSPAALKLPFSPAAESWTAQSCGARGVSEPSGAAGMLQHTQIPPLNVGVRSARHGALHRQEGCGWGQALAGSGQRTYTGPVE
jgi:hypothetical protein